MNSFIEKLRNFMYGRNGIDKLSFALLFSYLIFNGIKMFFRNSRVVFFILWAVAIVFLAAAIFRVLSKNLYRRRYEEEKFESFFNKIRYSAFIKQCKRKFNRLGVRISQFSTHRFRTCPQCGEHLRLSKKRGTRKITCPVCGRHMKVHILF